MSIIGIVSGIVATVVLGAATPEPEARAEIAWIERRAGRIARRRDDLAAAVESLKARGSEAQEELAATQRELREYETMMREIEARL